MYFVLFYLDLNKSNRNSIISKKNVTSKQKLEIPEFLRLFWRKDEQRIAGNSSDSVVVNYSVVKNVGIITNFAAYLIFENI